MNCIVFLVLLFHQGIGQGTGQGAGPTDSADTYLKRNAASWVMDLNHAQAKVRRGAAFALGKLGKHSLPHLGKLKAQLFHDTDASVREALASTLGELAPLAAADIASSLIQSLGKEGDLSVRRSLVMAIGKAGEPAGGAEPLLRKALDDIDAGMRRSAAFALGQLGKASEPALPGLTRLLADKDGGVRAETAQALGNLGSLAQEAIPQLITLLGDADTQVQEQCILALRKMGPLASAGISSLLTIAESGKLDAGLRQAALITVETIWPTGLKEPASWMRLQTLASSANDDAVKATAVQAEKKISALRK